MSRRNWKIEFDGFTFPFFSMNQPMISSICFTRDWWNEFSNLGLCCTHWTQYKRKVSITNYIVALTMCRIHKYRHRDGNVKWIASNSNSHLLLAKNGKQAMHIMNLGRMKKGKTKERTPTELLQAKEWAWSVSSHASIGTISSTQLMSNTFVDLPTNMASSLQFISFNSLADHLYIYDVIRCTCIRCPTTSRLQGKS